MKRIAFALVLVLAGVSISAAPTPPVAHDALDEVNAARAKRHLPPFQRDAGLTAGAKACASYRAARLIRAHTKNDFAFLPEGTKAGAAGCAALEPEWGFRACCMYEKWTFAGAASAVGGDGRVYHHLFVR